MKSATCIVGLKDGDKVWIGGDSAATGSISLGIRIRADQKVFMKKDSMDIEWVFGLSGAYRTMQLIHHVLELPSFDEEAQKDPFAFMVKKFIPVLQKCLQENGEQTTDKGVTSMDSILLIGIKDSLFGVSTNYQIESLVLNYNAIGCAEGIALGAMFATEGQDPEKRILTALKAAETFSSAVQGPFTILHT